MVECVAQLTVCVCMRRRVVFHSFTYLLAQTSLIPYNVQNELTNGKEEKKCELNRVRRKIKDDQAMRECSLLSILQANFIDFNCYCCGFSGLFCSRHTFPLTWACANDMTTRRIICIWIRTRGSNRMTVDRQYDEQFEFVSIDRLCRLHPAHFPLAAVRCPATDHSNDECDNLMG